MSTTPEESPVDTWGATPQDVKDLLLHITFAAPASSSNAHYAQNTTTTVTDDVLRRYIEAVAVQVSARLRGFASLPENAKPPIRAAARNVVATGAAHYAQTALFPSASDPNDGDAYADRLAERFEAGLLALGTIYDSEAADGGGAAGGGVLYSFPGPPLFPDRWPA